jgi:hypothetical protein
MRRFLFVTNALALVDRFAVSILLFGLVAQVAKLTLRFDGRETVLIAPKWLAIGLIVLALLPRTLAWLGVACVWIRDRRGS